MIDYSLTRGVPGYNAENTAGIVRKFADKRFPPPNKMPFNNPPEI